MLLTADIQQAMIQLIQHISTNGWKIKTNRSPAIYTSEGKSHYEDDIIGQIM